VQRMWPPLLEEETQDELCGEAHKVAGAHGCNATHLYRVDFVCKLYYFIRKWKLRRTTARQRNKRGASKNRRHSAGVFVGTVAQPGRVSGAMDLQLSRSSLISSSTAELLLSSTSTSTLTTTPEEEEEELDQKRSRSDSDSDAQTQDSLPPPLPASSWLLAQELAEHALTLAPSYVRKRLTRADRSPPSHRGLRANPPYCVWWLDSTAWTRFDRVVCRKSPNFSHCVPPKPCWRRSVAITSPKHNTYSTICVVSITRRRKKRVVAKRKTR
jgi:hypothetical protein